MLWWSEHGLGIGEVRRASKQDCYVDFLRTDFGLLRILLHRVHRVSWETVLEDKEKPAGKKTGLTEQKLDWNSGGKRESLGSSEEELGHSGGPQ